MGRLFRRSKNPGRVFTKPCTTFYAMNKSTLFNLPSLAPQKASTLMELCASVWHPFKTLKDLLTDPSRAKNVLTQDHHRLLFENYAALQQGEQVVLLHRSDHTYLTNDYWKPIMHKALQKNPVATRTINCKRFFIFKCVVRANHHADDFEDNTLTQDQIKKCCTYREGVAICFDIIGTEHDNDIAHTIDFFHYKFFRNLDSVQFWIVHHIIKLSGIKDYLTSSSIECCAAVTLVYVDKLIGDAAQLGFLIGFYQQKMGIETEKEVTPMSIVSLSQL